MQGSRLSQQQTVADLARAMDLIAPERLAEPWDNVGLLLGSSERALDGPVILTIDLSDAVVDEAVAARAAALVVYHPPIFAPVKRVSDQSALGRRLVRLGAARCAVYTPHTALDAAGDGLADWLADTVLDESLAQPTTPTTPSRPSRAGSDRRALRPAQVQPATEQVKLVTFLPEANADEARLALASAGAGRIGDYEACSFTSAGTGTFFGNPGTAPAAGRSGQLERVAEVRLEMVCSLKALPIALQTLRRFHPYQEPAIDVVTLLPKPERTTGAGRRLMLDRPVQIEELAGRVRRRLGLGVVHLARASAPGVTGRVSVIGVCPGSGGELAEAALADGCQAFVTGEMRHHDVMAMTAAGLHLILAGHTNTERGFMPALAERLRPMLPGVDVRVSARDADPLAAITA
ncbi:MAG: Nif3-like dinuclear metal center hexameric protein [Planctomyces sp.]|nr:Nif3-like dinuclear metal center hexameric protein [Planctomyces sp.]MBA4119863.1 Nif3-like dinuclear metal center hexameric protein [Isosphaera sp.]